MIKALGRSIIFQFIEKTQNGRMVDTLKSGIIITADATEQHKPRWATIISLGPDVKGIKEGEFIYIENGQWTIAMDYEGQKYWKTDDTKVLLVTDDLSEVTDAPSVEKQNQKTESSFLIMP